MPDTANDMVTPEQLSSYPGAPFAQDEVDGAVGILREALHWHVSPVRTETVSFDIPRMERRLLLRTRQLVSVDEIRTGEDVVDAEDYGVSTDLNMVKKKRGYWPSGYGAVEVDLTHGHETTPKSLLTVIAAIASSCRRDQTVREGVQGVYTLPLVGIDKILARHDAYKLQLGMA